MLQKLFPRWRAAGQRPPPPNPVTPNPAVSDQVNTEEKFSDFTEADLRLDTLVRPYTMTTSERIYQLAKAVEYIEKNAIPGAIVECGVWRGGSMMAAALALLRLGTTSREIYLYDTFEGMPPPKPIDIRHDGVAASEILSNRAKSKDDAYWAYASLEDVRANLASTGYPHERIHYVQGKVEDTLPQTGPATIALLRLDTDWYSSTRHELMHLYPRLSPEGVLIIDDYGWWKGQKQAVDEYFAQLPFQPLLQRIDSASRICIKPGR